ncbi:MAG: efflux RND transporter periplasmic adaptor subunit [Isosphaeraceae bacterium]
MPSEQPAPSGLEPSDLDAPRVQNPPLSRWRRFRMVLKVIELRLRFVALMTATGLVFGYWDTIWNHYEKWARPSQAGNLVSGAEFEFYCPMHPNVVRDTTASCPICGMPLSRRTRGQVEPLPDGVISRVAFSPTRIAQAGIRTAEVGYRRLNDEFTTVGTVEFDERRLARIASRAKGMSRVEKLLVNFTGTAVKAGEPLAELYSPELYQAVQELLLVQRRARAATGSRAVSPALATDSQELLRLGREKLILWGMTPGQVDALLASGRAEARLPILAPLSGVVVRKNIVEGQYVAEGEAMFEVADLSHVWVQAQIYEDQLARVRVGESVEATVAAFPGERFPGAVAFIDPALNPLTRTVGLRYDLENRDLRLRPGMFATVTLRSSIATIPAFRERLSRQPEAGSRSALGTPADQVFCPVTKLKLGAMGEPVAVQLAGRKVWTCCSACLPKLEATPDRYLARLAPPPDDSVLSVPESAVVDTGTRKVVYVETEPGVFEGRVVVLGPRTGDRYPVLEGLSAGDAVAETGAFLIDAETRLNPGSRGTAETPGKGEAAPPSKKDAEPAHHESSHRTASLSDREHRVQ